MSQAAELLNQGYLQMLAELGEQVTFRRETVSALVSAREAEMDLVDGGWRKGSTFVVELPTGAINPAPHARESIEIRGSVVTIRTVSTPHPGRPAWTCICEI